MNTYLYKWQHSDFLPTWRKETTELGIFSLDWLFAIFFFSINKNQSALYWDEVVI